MLTPKPPIKLSDASRPAEQVQPTDLVLGLRMEEAPDNRNVKWTAQTLADFLRQQIQAEVVTEEQILAAIKDLLGLQLGGKLITGTSTAVKVGWFYSSENRLAAPRFDFNAVAAATQGGLWDILLDPTPKADSITEAMLTPQVRAQLIFGSTSVTYAELVNLLATGGLVTSRWYLLSDYRTTYLIQKTTTTHTGPVEPLLFQATGPNSLRPVGYSTVYPQDEVYWQAANNQTRMPGATTGVILRRVDTQYQNDLPFDFRQARFRRWRDTATSSTYGASEDNGFSFTDYPMFDANSYAGGSIRNNRLEDYAYPVPVHEYFNIVVIGGSFKGNISTADSFWRHVTVRGGFVVNNTLRNAQLRDIVVGQSASLSNNTLRDSSFDTVSLADFSNGRLNVNTLENAAVGNFTTTTALLNKSFSGNTLSNGFIYGQTAQRINANYFIFSNSFDEYGDVGAAYVDVQGASIENTYYLNNQVLTELGKTVPAHTHQTGDILGLQAFVESIVGSGGVADGSITDAKLASDNKIGSLAAFQGTVKTSLVGIANYLWGLITDLRSDVGSLPALLTTAKNNLVGAINEVRAEVLTRLTIAAADERYALKTEIGGGAEAAAVMGETIYFWPDRPSEENRPFVIEGPFSFTGEDLVMNAKNAKNLTYYLETYTAANGWTRSAKMEHWQTITRQVAALTPEQRASRQQRIFVFLEPTTDTLAAEATVFVQRVTTTPADPIEVLFADTFTRADSTTSPGPTWVPLVGVWGIFNNRTYLVSGNGFMSVPATEKNYHVEADVIMGAVVQSIGVSGNYTDNNYRITAHIAAADRKVRLITTLNGTSVTLKSDTVETLPNTTTKLGLRRTGDTLTVYVNEVLKLTHVMTAQQIADFAGRTRAGLRCDAAAVGNTYGFDNFKLTTVPV